MNRVSADGRPLDLVMTNGIQVAVGNAFPSLINWLGERDLNKRFDHEMYSLKPNHRFLRKPFTEIFLQRFLLSTVGFRTTSKH